MPQIAPYLPPHGSKGRGVSSAPSDRDALNLPKLPVAGFWRRLGAFLFDLLLIWTTFRLLTTVAPQVFYAMGSWTPKVGSLAIILYFTLGNGPAGKGRTVGKFLTAIRTTDYAGNPPTFPQALLRTLLLLPILVLLYWISPRVLDDGNFMHTKIREMVSGYLMVSLFFATVLTIVFNPFKQGLHDYLVKTLVRPVAAPQLPFADLCGMVGERWKRYQRHPVISGTVTLVLIWAAFLIMTWPSRVTPEMIERFEVERSLMKQAEVPGAEFGGMSPGALEGSMFDAEVRRAFYADINDESSTATLGLVLFVSRYVPGPLDESSREKTRQFAQDYYDVILRNYTFAQLFPSAEAGDPGEPPRFRITNFRQRPITVQVLIFEKIDLVFPYQQKEADRVEVDFPPLGELAGS